MIGITNLLRFTIVVFEVNVIYFIVCKHMTNNMYIILDIIRQ